MKRFFLHSLFKSKVAAILNISGLVLAFIAFILILGHVRLELEHDKHHPNADQVFAIYQDAEQANQLNTILARGFVDMAIASSPHIKSGTLVNYFIGNPHIYITDSQDNRHYLKENLATVYPDYPRVFGLTFTEGNGDCLADPQYAIIPQSMAKRMFPGESAIGKKISFMTYVWSKDEHKFVVVGGVYKDQPSNSQVHNHIYTTINNTQKDDYQSANYLAFIRIDDSVNQHLVEKEINKKFNEINTNPQSKQLKLVPITDVYYFQESTWPLIKTGNIQITYMLLGVAFIIIALALINFINFSISLTPLRIKSINIRKVLGANLETLRFAIIAEAVVMCLTAYICTLLITGILQATNVSDIFATASVFSTTTIIGGFLFSILAGTIAGIYPAVYSTSVKPAMVLKGSFALSRTGRKVRFALIGFQYISSITLIICTLYIHTQMSYIRTFSYGYNTNNLAIVDIGNNAYATSGGQYREELKKHPDIIDVAFASAAFGGTNSYPTYEFAHLDRTESANLIQVTPNFMEVMEIPLIEGKIVDSGLWIRDTVAKAIISAEMAARLNVTIGGNITNGWTKDIKVEAFSNPVKANSLHTNTMNIVLLIANSYKPYSFIRIRPGSNLKEVNQYIYHAAKNVAPDYPIEIETFDSMMQRQYQREYQTIDYVTGFSIVTIILALMGILGLIAFESQYKQKEVGIRKVFGATEQSLLLRFTTHYLLLVSCCFLIAIPIATTLVNNWNSNFTNTPPLYWWQFALAFLFVALLTLLIVALQTRKTIVTDPIDTLRNE